ncbi:TonB-dependent receptor plug domain-containing protein [Maricaulis parjimensis]|uniref:TonB-dependent receptor plug domain-containing protein n=1 Tax=Maricaulis parjimensis TaxID=144023 RepID=UPI001939CA41|nr:TonB-dependent receptor [Maricaulis parjimensis]
MDAPIEKGRLLRSTILAGLTVVSLSGAPVFAQDAVQIPEQAEEEDDEDTRDRITVTGSRIRRDGFNSEIPLDVFTADDAALQGTVDIADFLQSATVASGSPQVTSATSSQFVQNGGSGVETLSLRGLGANRTLVLLNGRRAGPAGVRGGVSSFDLNVIPLAAIERVEVLKDGASSIYGSDAVAGVVNIITREETGGTIDGFMSFPEDGAAEQFRLSASHGWEFERGGFRVTLDAFQQRELAQGDRDYFSCGEPYVFNDDGSRADLIDPRTGSFACEDLLWGHVWVYDYARFFGDGTTNLPIQRPRLIQYDYDGSLAANGLTPIGTSQPNPLWFSAPTDDWFLINPRVAEDRALANFDHPFQDQSTMVPETERYTLFANGHYDITDSIELYGEALLNRRETYVNAYRQYWIYMYNGEDLWGAYPDPFAAGWGGMNELSPTPITDHADSSVSVDYQRFVIGLQGDTLFGLDTWSWDMALQSSRSEGEYWNQRIYADAIYDQYYRSASCVGSFTSIRGAPCVDVDWLDPELLRGNVSDEVAEYAFGEETGLTVYEQLSFEAVANGELFDLPAGPVAMALGIHYREDSIDDTPGELTLSGNVWNSSVAGITEGSDTTQAMFGELSIPVLSGSRFAESLELTVSGRYTDVDSYGSGETYKVGLNWALNDVVRFRATHGTSFRTPALFELYLSNQTSFQSQRAVDPCVNWAGNLAANLISQRVADNCAADGIPDNLSGAGASATIITGGGLGVLEAETSDATNIGIVLTPRNINFRLSIDYYEIEVNDEVSRLGAQGIVGGCYSSDDFANEPLCDLFTRNSPTDPGPYLVSTVRDSFININSQRNTGIDINADYLHSFDFGDLSVNLSAAYQLEDTTDLLGGVIQDFNGEGGEPKLVGDLNFTFTRNDWTAFWGMRYVDRTSNRDSYGNAAQLYVGENVNYKLWTESVVYHNVSVQREFGAWSARFGVSNLFDEHPPAVTGISGEYSTVGRSAFYSQYDWFGRRFFANIVREF